MDLCDKFFYDLVEIYPPMNDYLLYQKFLKKKGSLPNKYSIKYIKKEDEIINKYIKELKDKNLSFCEKILKYDINYNNKISFF